MMGVDLVLSSGFLAFAEQAGFLAAVEDAGLQVDGVCGTSSGALAGGLWTAGLSAVQIYEELCGRRPMSWIRPSWSPWRGAFDLVEVRKHLADRVPATFAELPLPFGVGVAANKQAHLLTKGTLPDAIAASCAVPYLFRPVVVDGRTFIDGGAVDRTAMNAWRSSRPGRIVVLHLMDSSLSASSSPPVADLVVSSPRSGASLWSLGDHRHRFDRTRTRVGDALRRALSEGILQAV